MHLHSASFFLKKFLAAVCCRDLPREKNEESPLDQESKAINPVEDDKFFGKSRYILTLFGIFLDLWEYAGLQLLMLNIRKCNK